MQNLKKLLERFYHSSGPERVGFITGHQVVEVQNWVTTSEDGWMISADDSIKHENADATWHTHPGHTSNLGGEDYHTFREWPEMKHFIIGNDGVRCYQYDKERKAVMEI